MKRRVAGITVLGVVAGLAWAAPGQSVISSNSDEVLALLHDGRFVEAERRTRPAAGSTDLQALFEDAFVDYWRLLYDDKNPSLQAEFDKSLTRTIHLAQGRLSRQPKDADALLYGGTAHLLRGQLLARQKKPLAAANEAKRARKLLLQSSDPDALFGLGSYNYLTDQLQGAARGLRVLMGIPAGNREEGLRQLDRAAREGKRFRLESRLLLMSIYAGKRERRLDDALRQAERLLREHGSFVVALDAAARTQLLAGHADRAGVSLDRALGEKEADPSVVAALRVQRARVELARSRPDLALEWLQPLLAKPAAVPVGLRDELQETAAAAKAAPAAS